MAQKKLTNRRPDDPVVVERVLARLRAMSREETLAMLAWRPEGVEETNMNETLAEYDRKKREEASRSKVA